MVKAIIITLASLLAKVEVSRNAILTLTPMTMAIASFYLIVNG